MMKTSQRAGKLFQALGPATANRRSTIGGVTGESHSDRWMPISDRNRDSMPEVGG